MERSDVLLSRAEHYTEERKELKKWDHYSH